MNCTIIGISGGTASGKTTIAKKLLDMTALLGETLYIKMDNYYLDRSDIPVDQRESLNYDHPNSFDSKLLIQHLNMLQSGRSVCMPIYDFSTHTRSRDSVTLFPKKVIIVEGIMLFAIDELERLLDIKIYVETPDDIRFIRRLMRDVNERGRTFDSVVHQYLDFVRPMHNLFVNPSKSKAHIIVPEGGENSVAIDLLNRTILQLISETNNNED